MPTDPRTRLPRPAVAPAAATALVPPLPDRPWGIVCDEHGAPTAVVAAVDVAVKVTGLAVASTWTVRFQNTSPHQLEAFYLFPLPAGSAVTAARARFGEHRVDAELAERAVARDLFDAAVNAGHQVAMVEADRAEAFTLTIGRLAPGEHPEITIELVATLDVDHGRGTVRVPLVVAPRYTPLGVPVGGPDAHGVLQDPDASRVTAPRATTPAELPQATVTVSWNGSTEPPRCPTGGADIRAEGDGWVVAWSGLPDRDVVVQAAALPAPAVAVTFPHPGGAGHVVRVDVLGPASERAPAPRDVAVLVDRSGSMGGWKMAAAQRLAIRLVDSLDAEDRTLVVGFDTEVLASATGLRAADAAARRELGRFVETLTARGGTELARAITWTCAALHRDGCSETRRRVLVLVTDAQVTDEANTVASLTAHLGDAEVYVIGVDQAVNAGLCRDLATVGGGRFDLVTEPEAVAAVLERAVARVGRPVVADLIPTPPGRAPALPRSRVPLFAGAVATRWIVSDQDPAGTELALTGASSDGWRATVAVVRADDVRAHQGVWAAAELAALTREHDAGDPTAAALATSLSLAAGVLCRFTAFIAVDHDGHRLAGPTLPVVQPLAVPAGLPAAAPVAAGPPLAHRGGALARFRATAVAADAAEAVAARPAAPHTMVGAGLRRRILTVLDHLEHDPETGGAELRELVDDLRTLAAPTDLVARLERLLAVGGDQRRTLELVQELRTHLGTP